MRPIARIRRPRIAVGRALGGGGGHPAGCGGDLEGLDRDAPPPHHGWGNDVQRLHRCCPC